MEPVFFPGGHMLKLHSKIVPTDPGHFGLNDEERIFLIGQIEEQREIHAGADRLVAPDSQTSSRHIDNHPIPQDNSGLV